MDAHFVSFVELDHIRRKFLIICLGFEDKKYGVVDNADALQKGQICLYSLEELLSDRLWQLLDHW